MFNACQAVEVGGLGAERRAWHDEYMALWLTGDETADALLESNDFALLAGMLLDQQVTMELAFAGPVKLDQRLGKLTPESIAETDSERLLAAFKEVPAVHRYPGSMADRLHAVAQELVDNWDGDAAALWTRGNPSGPEVLKRLKSLPGFGDQKARIFLALLGKQRGFSGEGWEAASAPYGEPDATRSIADVVDRASLEKVREFKKAAKAAARKG